MNRKLGYLRLGMESLEDRRLLSGNPDLAWMSYHGGANSEDSQSVVTDSTGNIYLTGKTNSSNFYGATNTFKGGADAFVEKVSPAGAVLWAIYLGGTLTDAGSGIALDSDGNIFVTGETNSSDFHGATNTYKGSSEAFVDKLTPAGALQWAIYLGGSNIDIGAGVAVDASGNALVTGNTYSTDFVGKNNNKYGDFDAYAAKIASDGTLCWATYLGGSNDEEAFGIATDSAGNAYVSGYTKSTGFGGVTHTLHGSYDTFAAKISSSGLFQWASYFGGSGGDYGYAIALDASNQILLAGATTSTDIPGANNSFRGGTWDAYLAKFTSDGTLAWSKYLGGTGNDWCRAVDADPLGNIYIAGYSNSTDFFAANNANHGKNDGFVAKTSASGSLAWTTCLGGSLDDSAFGISVSGSGEIFVTGSVISLDFEGKINASKGGTDAFVVKLIDLALPAARIWSGGGGEDRRWTTAANWVGNIAPLPGDNLVFPADAANQENINDYSSEVVFGAITILGGEYRIQNHPLQSTSIEVKGEAVLTVASIVCDTLIIGSTGTGEADTNASKIVEATAEEKCSTASDPIPMDVDVAAEILSFKANLSAAEPAFILQEDVTRIDTKIPPMPFVVNRKTYLDEQKSEEKLGNSIAMSALRVTVTSSTRPGVEALPSTDCKTRALHLAALKKVFRENQTWNIFWPEEFCQLRPQINRLHAHDEHGHGDQSELLGFFDQPFQQSERFVGRAELGLDERLGATAEFDGISRLR
jgi:hypothetical protein